MAMHTCVQCGQPLEEKAKFCGQCGTVVEANRLAAPTANRTLVALPPTTSSVPPAAPVAVGKRTIVGLPSLGNVGPGANAPAGPPPTAPVVSPPNPPMTAPMRRTMLGVAMPGIAPLHTGQADLPRSPGPTGPVGPTIPATGPTRLPDATVAAGVRPGDETVAALPEPTPLGAPLPPRVMGETMPIPAFFVPPPAPLPEVAPPSEPLVARRPGAPLFVAALIAGGVALVGGAAIALLWRGAPPISAQPRIAADGRDVLHLVCDTRSCGDGTIASLDGAKGTFLGGETDLTLPLPLRVGDNQLSLSIDRPGMGRDETVKLVVPVAYRVRADVTTMEASHPSITIRVEAPAGTDVRVDDKPVTLDATGAGAYVVDESAVTEGPADESRVISLDLPYVVVPRGHTPENGTVSARIAVAPLRVDAPGPRTVLDEDHILIAGRAAKGATATVDGKVVTTAADGSFETSLAIDSPGDRTIEVRAGTQLLSPRTVQLAVTRVGSLADAAKSFESKAPIGYDAAMRDIASSRTGEPIVVEGEVVEARGSGHGTVVLVDDRRGCARGPCIVRVMVGRAMALQHGESMRAYGSVARAYKTPSGQSVPEVEAEFVLRSKR
jgi:hypothetical protein